MRNALLIAALTLASASAFASKARLTAIQNARTAASDFQELFDQPAKMWDLADQATFEYGPSISVAPTAAAQNPVHAEGGFIRSGENSKWGMYLGRTNPSLTAMLAGVYLSPQGPLLGTAFAATPGESATLASNPLSVFYGGKAGDLNYGLSAYYASSEDEGAMKKNAMGVTFGVGAEGWTVNAVVGLNAKFENLATSSEFKGDASYQLDGEYAINDVLLGYGTFTQFGGTLTNAGAETAKYNVQRIQVGVESKVKSDVAHFFYGARLENNMAENKTTGRKLDGMILPIYFGVEADAASWLVLRSALTQNVLLGTYKFTAANGATAAKITPDSTMASLGAGLKFGKLMLDGGLSAGTDGNLNAANLMTDASLTYVF